MYEITIVNESWEYIEHLIYFYQRYTVLGIKSTPTRRRAGASCRVTRIGEGWTNVILPEGTGRNRIAAGKQGSTRQCVLQQGTSGSCRRTVEVVSETSVRTYTYTLYTCIKQDGVLWGAPAASVFLANVLSWRKPRAQKRKRGSIIQRVLERCIDCRNC